MAMGGSLKPMAALVFALSLLVVVRSADECPDGLFKGCDWIDKDQTNCTCFTEFTCYVDHDFYSILIRSLEECPSEKTPWFVASEATVEAEGPCDQLYLEVKSPEVYLATPFDLEKEKRANFFCFDTFKIDGIPYAVDILFLDVNEYSPMPNSGSTQSQIKVDENQSEVNLITLQYKDDDFGETRDMKAAVVFPSAIEVDVELRNERPSDDVYEVEVWLPKGLDYEENNFYEFNIEFTSEDDIGEASSSNHTIYLFVQDQGDTKPIWVKPVFSVKFPEGAKGRTVFTAKARDGDFVVNNDIKYSIVSESVSGYFAVDPDSGEVTNVKEIDYADLHETDNTSIMISIEAREYYKDGTVAAEPNNSLQETMIIIEDLNDQRPTFSTNYLEICVDELPPGTPSSPVLTENIFVMDMDVGINGTYTLTADDGLNVKPPKGTGKTQIEVEIRTTETTSFDFEQVQDTPRLFTITAIEEANKEHRATLKLNITLKDQNDNSPEFLKKT